MKLIDQVLATRPKVTEWRGEPVVFIEEKMDGRRVAIVKEDGIVAIGRKTYIDLWPLLSQDASLRRRVESLPDRTALDGELYVPGLPSSEVMTRVNDGKGFYFQPFAMPMLGGQATKDWTFEASRLAMATLDFLPPAGYAATTEALGATTELAVEALCSKARTYQIEGYVLKRQLWGEWYKVKPTKTADLIVVGWKVGQGRHEGRLGALIGALADGTVVADVGGGFSDAQRDAFTEAFTIGKVMEVEYDRVESQGRLRFPRFVQWRDDKPASECVMV